MPKRIVTDVLEHIRTHRITVPEAVANVYGLDKTTAQELLETFVTAGISGKAALTPWQSYYYLLPKAAEILHVDSVDAGPITGTAKVVAYATLYFCCMEGTYRPLIPAHVFRSRFAELYRPGPKINYYTEGQTLGYIRVETGDSTKGDAFRVVDRCWRDVVKRTSPKGRQFKAFKHLHQANRFVVTVLTAFPGKVERVTDAVNQMRERRALYDIRAADIKEHGKEYFTKNEPAFLAYHQWHRKNPDRRPPRRPPPMQIKAVPGLIDLIYPKPPIARQ